MQNTFSQPEAQLTNSKLYQAGYGNGYAVGVSDGKEDSSGTIAYLTKANTHQAELLARYVTKFDALMAEIVAKDEVIRRLDRVVRELDQTIDVLEESRSTLRGLYYNS